MLGRLEIDIDECINAYSGLAAAGFAERLRSIPINFTGDITARFDGEAGEREPKGDRGQRCIQARPVQ
jgi:hypothetical protein